MDLATIKEAIRTAVANATGLDIVRVQWVGTPESGQWRPWPCVDLVFRRPVKLGWDNHIRTFVPTDPEDPEGAGVLTRTIAGPRTFTVEIRVETDNQDGGAEAMTYVTRLQTRLQRPAIGGSLSAAGVNVATIADGVDADITVDDRVVSLSVLDVVFNAVENDVDTTEVGDYAESFRFETTPDLLRAPGGTAAEHQVTVTVPEE